MDASKRYSAKDWLAGLVEREKAIEQPEGWYSCQQIAKALGISTRGARAKAEQHMAAGDWEQMQARVKTTDGRTMMTLLYREKPTAAPSARTNKASK